MRSHLHSQIEHHDAVDRLETVRLASLSTRERGVLLLAACRSAAAIYHSRLAAGLPAEEPAPWPASTWNFLNAQAQHVRNTSST